MLGSFQFGMAALIAPLAGVGGTHDATPMITLILAMPIAAVVSRLLLGRPGPAADGDPGGASGPGRGRRRERAVIPPSVRDQDSTAEELAPGRARGRGRTSVIPTGPRRTRVMPTGRGRTRVMPTGWRQVALIGTMSIFGPLCIDMYLPALPQINRDLHASASEVQLTLTACLIGIAAGQLLIGPVSDRLGRRLPLLIGLASFVFPPWPARSPRTSTS